MVINSVVVPAVDADFFTEDAAIFTFLIILWTLRVSCEKLVLCSHSLHYSFHTRKYAYPRPVAMAAVQVIMPIALFYYAMSGPRADRTWLLGPLGNCPCCSLRAVWIEKFWCMYNFLTLASPAGSLIFSGMIASGVYDYEAKQQSTLPSLQLGREESLTSHGYICYSITCGILSGFCTISVVLSLIVVHRTKRVCT